jgi:osmotically-inducible protein OsmY
MDYNATNGYSTWKVTAAGAVTTWAVLAWTAGCSVHREPNKPTVQQDTNAVASNEPDKPILPQDAHAVAPRDPKAVTDHQIANTVDHLFLTDGALHNKQISVVVNQGIVTLRGAVDNLMTEERAAKLAQTIRGVRAVVNTITLKTSSRPDSDIRKDVDAAMHYDAATESYALTPEVKDGVVTLTGAVPSYRAKVLVVYVAKGVKGVKGVTDGVTVKSSRDRPDAEIAAEVTRALAIDVWLHPNFIHTDVKGGVVTLTGIVRNPAQHERADLLAWTAGVKGVSSLELKVDPWAKPSGERSEMVPGKSDPQVREAVRDAFLYDPRVFAFGPEVEVENGVATLTGVVDNLKANRAAEQDAKNTWGVWQVKNLLKVQLANPAADDKLAQIVNAALLRDSILDGYDLNVKAKNGTVTLNGSVSSNFDRAEAEDVASRAKGVIHVTDNLTVSEPILISYDVGYDPYWSYQPYYSYWDGYRAPYYSLWPTVSDAVVKYNIDDNMFWSPWLGSDTISVKVVNGVATLSGTADSWFESYKAAEYAYEGGAQQVNNNIAIR